jgi:hypothetical protein
VHAYWLRQLVQFSPGNNRSGPDLPAAAESAALDGQRHAELNRVVAMLADVEAQAYQRAFNELARLHDRLCGYASVMENNIGDIRRIIEPLKTVRFTLPSLASSIDADPFIRHNLPNDHVVNEAARYWKMVREKLDADSSADLASSTSRRFQASGGFSVSMAEGADLAGSDVT